MGRSGDGGLKIDEVEKEGDDYHSFSKKQLKLRSCVGSGKSFDL